MSKFGIFHFPLISHFVLLILPPLLINNKLHYSETLLFQASELQSLQPIAQAHMAGLTHLLH